jgi:predicted MFS family arabinose efflux permease
LVVNLPAGPLVDRWDRRRIMLVSEFAAGVALATIPIALWFGVLTVAQLAAVAFIQGTGSVFFRLAQRAALPSIVPPSLLPTALAQNEAKTRGASLAGPPLGGLLFGLGRAVPFVADAVSYAIATASLTLVRRNLQPERVTAPKSLWRDAIAGLRWTLGHPLVRASTALIAISNMIFQALTLALVVLAQRGGAKPAEIGLMFGIYGCGGFLGALAATRLHRHLAPKTVLIGVNWVWAALLPLYLCTSEPVLLGVIGAATAFVGPLWNVVGATYMSLLVPNEMLGRVNSAIMTVSWGVIPLGSLAGGYLLTGIGPTSTILVLVGVMVATAIGCTLSRAIRSAPAFPTDADQSPQGAHPVAVEPAIDEVSAAV